MLRDMAPSPLPKIVILVLCLLSMTPYILFMLGFDYSLVESAYPEEMVESDPQDPYWRSYYHLAGPFVHTILAWTGVSIAMVTVMLSFIHYRLKGEITTPIIGTALFFSAMLDAFNILAADRSDLSGRRPESFCSLHMGSFANI